jgi:hypothetical protein
MISPPSFSASRMPTEVLPIPVGPQMTMTFGFFIADFIFVMKSAKGYCPSYYSHHRGTENTEMYVFLSAVRRRQIKSIN